jgi:diguanylate cyclase (GGDEF)-like protein
MDKVEAGPYHRDYDLIREARQVLDASPAGSGQLKKALAEVIAGYDKLLSETLKIHTIADRQYTRLVETQEKLLEVNQELERISIHDKLTGLYNRRKLEEVLNHEVQRCVRFSSPATLILIDLDHFKRINDSFGHLAGDFVLREVANLIRDRIRRTDHGFRWGGEEFLVFLAETKQVEGMVMAQTLRKSIETYSGFSVGQVTASLGVREYRVPWTVEAWIEETDLVLYKAKTLGRNRVEGEP